jgi:hyperosmotically inducible periplasmic protein
MPAATPSEEDVYRTVNKVRKEIFKLSTYGVFDYLTFNVEPGESGIKIRLNGFASRPILKKSAEDVVKRIESVSSVDNQIEVLPLSPRDEDLRMAVYAKIYYDSTLSRYNPSRGMPVYGLERRRMIGISNDPPFGVHPIHIIVKNGNVTLEGNVDTEMDKTIAGLKANGTSAFSVTNNLAVPQKNKKTK